MKLIIIFIVLIFANGVIAESYSFELNEIFPNPKGKDNTNPENLEFVEIYNFGDSSLNLDGFEIRNSKNKTLILNIYYSEIKPHEYLFFYSSKNFTLKNTNEKISLFYNDTVIDEFNYNKSKDDFSWSKVNKNWTMLKPSPGRINLEPSSFFKEKASEEENLAENNFKRDESLPEIMHNTKIKEAVNNKNKVEYENLLNLSNNKNRIIYEGKGLKQGRLGLYLFLFTLVLIIISLLVENGRRKGNKSKDNNRSSGHAY